MFTLSRPIALVFLFSGTFSQVVEPQSGEASRVTQGVSASLSQASGALVPVDSRVEPRATQGVCFQSKDTIVRKADSSRREGRSGEETSALGRCSSRSSLSCPLKSSCTEDSRRTGLHCQSLRDEQEFVLGSRELSLVAAAARGGPTRHKAEEALWAEFRMETGEDIVVEIEPEEEIGAPRSAEDERSPSADCSSPAREMLDQAQTVADASHTATAVSCPPGTPALGGSHAAGLLGSAVARSPSQGETGWTEGEPGAAVSDEDVERAVEAMVAQLLHWLSEAEAVHSGDLVEW